MSKKSKSSDYRALKKVLNGYYYFSFKTPRKGKDFTPQQKSAITRKLKKLSGVIDNDGKVVRGLSFIPYPKHSKLPGVDAVRTNKGLFYKLPGAKATKDKKGKYKVVVNVGNRRDIFFPFPKSIMTDLSKIESFVSALEKKYKPETIRWSTLGRRESNIYQPDIFNKYISIETIESDSLDNEIDLLDEFINSVEFDYIDEYEKREYYRKLSFLKKHKDTPTFYNGVFFTWFKD